MNDISKGAKVRKSLNQNLIVSYPALELVQLREFIQQHGAYQMIIDDTGLAYRTIARVSLTGRARFKVVAALRESIKKHLKELAKSEIL